MLRVVDSLQLTDDHKVATLEGNWERGDDVVIVPSNQDEDEIEQRFPKGCLKAVKSYLRMPPGPQVQLVWRSKTTPAPHRSRPVPCGALAE